MHRWALVLLFVAGCGPSSLRTELAEVEGVYKGDEFEPREQVEAILVDHNRDDVVSQLIACLDDAQSSRTLYAGKPVPVGIVCYEALKQTVTHEPTDENGDVAATWAGELTPRSSVEEMRAAKTAWTSVVANNEYSFQ